MKLASVTTSNNKKNLVTSLIFQKSLSLAFVPNSPNTKDWTLHCYFHYGTQNGLGFGFIHSSRWISSNHKNLHTLSSFTSLWPFLKTLSQNSTLHCFDHPLIKPNSELQSQDNKPTEKPCALTLSKEAHFGHSHFLSVWDLISSLTNSKTKAMLVCLKWGRKDQKHAMPCTLTLQIFIHHFLSRIATAADQTTFTDSLILDLALGGLLQKICHNSQHIIDQELHSNKKNHAPTLLCIFCPKPCPKYQKSLAIFLTISCHQNEPAAASNHPNPYSLSLGIPLSKWQGQFKTT